MTRSGRKFTTELDAGDAVGGRFDLEAFSAKTRGDRGRDRSLVLDDGNPALHIRELRSAGSGFGGNRVHVSCR
jgi:hypothetical protein